MSRLYAAVFLAGVALLAYSTLRDDPWQAGVLFGVALAVGGLVAWSDRRARAEDPRPGYIYDRERDR